MVRESPPDPPWIVEGLVVRGTLTILNGREGVGKSLLASALAAAVATGATDAGMSCQRGRVLVVDAENGPHEIHRRVHALRLPAENIAIYEADGFDLRRGGSELESVLEQHRPSLLVLDSFRSLWRGEENDSREVAAVLDPLRNLIRRLGAGTLLLHHSGKGEGAGYRGSSAIGAYAELGFTLARNRGDNEGDRRCLCCWKCRPAQEPPPRWLRLSVETGQVYIDQTEPPDEDRRGSAAPVRSELRPKIRAVLTETAKSRAEIARAVGREPKDRSVGRVLDDLHADGYAEKVGPDSRAGWRVASEIPPGGGRHLPPVGSAPSSRPEDPGGNRPSESANSATRDDAKEQGQLSANGEHAGDDLAERYVLEGGAS
jgi:hypothetical protein